MHNLEIILGLLIVVSVLVTVAEKIQRPYPILLVLGGLVIGFIPQIPDVQLSPSIVFLIFLPPLLFADAFLTSWRDFVRNLRPILLLAIGLVVTTTLIVAAVAHAIVPHLSWAGAFVLGAVLAPTDTIAAGQIIRKMGVPRRIVTVLSSESLVNDATALVIYSLAIHAVTAGQFHLGSAALQFVGVSLGGIVLGLGLGWLVDRGLRLVDHAPVENTISLLAPFFAYLLAEKIHVSGVLAVVASGLYLGRQSARLFSSDTRLTAQGFWQMLTFLLNGLLFIFVGLQLHPIVLALQKLHNQRPWELAVQAGWVSLAVISARIFWVFPAAYLPRSLSPRLRQRDPPPDWRNVCVIAWTGMRGGISLAAALAIPKMLGPHQPFPNRDLIIFLTFGVILATLVAQGLSLPALIRALQIHQGDGAALEENTARLKAAEAAVQKLEGLAADDEGITDDVEKRLRAYYQQKIRRYNARFDDDADGAEEEKVETFGRIKRELVAAEREVVIQLRDDGEISDEVLAQVQRDLDLEELRLLSL